mgnify:CR=1 FL=1
MKLKEYLITLKNEITKKSTISNDYINWLKEVIDNRTNN